jgi:hypothetical protein
MAVILITAYALSQPIVIVKHHASNLDKGKRAHECKHIMLVYLEFLAMLCIINAACDARVRETKEHL